MSQWPHKPFIYEINTAVWLTTLSKKYHRPITLGSIPAEVLDDLIQLHVDALWLMGIWQRSPAGRASALNYIHEYRPILPDLTEADIMGSAYAIGAYEVDGRLGGRDGLAALRQELQQRGLRLILDYVPNHVASDHPWVTENTHYMVCGTDEDLKKNPGMFYEVQDTHGDALVVAHGRDPYFPGWIDTAQVNAFSMEYRAAARDMLLDIASQCDAVRCDMGMLLVNQIFKDTWGAYVEEAMPETEFWEDIIPAVKAQYPDFLFIAEVYWGMEYTLLTQGFDYTYDKTLYDRILEGNVNKLREHLIAAVEYQERQVRFIENHDEPRAAASLGIEKGRAAATLICTLPGATLLHDGQFIARTAKLPVQISRQPHHEAPNHALDSFYRRLLKETRAPIYQHGIWRLLPIHQSFEGVDTHNHLLAYGWIQEQDLRLIVINLTPAWSQGLIQLAEWNSVTDHHWLIRDVLRGTYQVLDGKRVAQDGYYVELEAYQPSIFHFERMDENWKGAFLHPESSQRTSK